MKDTTIVIGAGITGLTAAHTLKEAGRDVVVFEASNRPGGRIVRLTRNGDAVEGGAQGIHSNYREMLKLVNSYGLSQDLVPQSNVQAAYLDRRGGIRFPEGNLGLAKLLGVRGTLDLAWFTVRYLAMSKRFSFFETDRDIPEYDNISAAEAFSWAGANFRDFVLRPAAHGMANTTIEHTNLYHTLNLMKMFGTSKVMTLRTGNVALAEQIAERVNVQYERAVSKILTNRGKVEGVLLENGTTVRARHVIVACSIDRAAKVVPDEMRTAKAFLSSFPNAPFSLVYFFLDRPLQTRAFAYVGHAYRNAVFNLALNHTVKTPHLVPSGKAIISAWPCYPEAAALAEQSEADVIAQALGDVDAFFPGISQWVDEARVQRHAWGIGRFAPGQHAKILAFKKEAEAFRGISFAGNDYDGVHMEAGVRGGIRAAERALKADE
ncbi:protoporphyrinogen/coproporphyrinogen oxidase [Burkholderia seminalis]|uniref:FAD-dependent oxidoreductase n=2 Tax=Burkholderia cepacia complex TaxID=87882 RepID=A0A8A8DE59_9BURK|nr:NAD(P)/FAD-dependent oxidoreductase [Burkholderia seminalis]QTO23395.1 FAD-dependent oxidoreductase [Burkholderia seminalis]